MANYVRNLAGRWICICAYMMLMLGQSSFVLIQLAVDKLCEVKPKFALGTQETDRVDSAPSKSL